MAQDTSGPDAASLISCYYYYGVGGCLLENLRPSVREFKARMMVESDQTENLDINVGLREGWIMSPWLVYLFCTPPSPHMAASLLSHSYVLLAPSDFVSQSN